LTVKILTEVISRIRRYMGPTARQNVVPIGAAYTVDCKKDNSYCKFIAVTCIFGSKPEKGRTIMTIMMMTITIIDLSA
jgi:hypothetical protein